jgi:hypothetical protein
MLWTTGPLTVLVIDKQSSESSNKEFRFHLLTKTQTGASGTTPQNMQLSGGSEKSGRWVSFYPVVPRKSMLIFNFSSSSAGKALKNYV